MSLAGSDSELRHKVLLGLLQNVQAVLALQVHIRPLKWSQMICHTPKPRVLNKNMSLAGSEAELLHEVVLDILQPIQAVLALHSAARGGG